VRGYVADLLRDCRLSADQVIEDEPEGSPFSARVRATVPETGQLLRWLLGCGANVEVLAPAKWREVVVSQLEKMGAIYGLRRQAEPGATEGVVNGLHHASTAISRTKRCPSPDSARANPTPCVSTPFRLAPAGG
jgi:hypothetical protein